MNAAALLPATVLAVFTAGLAHGAGTFTPPEGCTLDMTVQLRECRVANHYHCAGDPSGERWISYADGAGEYFLSRIDAETRWIESISLQTGEVDRLDAGASADNADFSALLATGRDDYDFITRNNFGETSRYVGYDQLTGEQVTIDGVTLERCVFELEATDGNGNVLFSRKGTQYVSVEHRVFYGDIETFRNALGEEVQSVMSPVTFAFEGEDGFGEAEPKFDCDMLMTGQFGIGGRS